MAGQCQPGSTQPFQSSSRAASASVECRPVGRPTQAQGARTTKYHPLSAAAGAPLICFGRMFFSLGDYTMHRPGERQRSLDYETSELILVGHRM